MTAEKPLVEATSHVQTGLEDATLLLYPLLALSMVLLFSSLSLALVVFLRVARAKTSNPGAKGADHNQEFAVQHGQEVGQPGQSSKGKCGVDVSQRPQSAKYVQHSSLSHRAFQIQQIRKLLPIILKLWCL